MSERDFTRLVGHSLGRKLLFVFPLTNAQLDLTKRKMSSNGSANVKQLVMRASSYLNCLKKKTRKHLLSKLRNERGLLGFNNMMHTLHEYRAK